MSTEHPEAMTDAAVALVEKTVFQVAGLIVATACDVMEHSIDMDCGAAWLDGFGSFRTMTQPTHSNEALLDAVRKGRAMMADDVPRFDQRNAEAGALLTDLCGVLVLASLDSVARKRGLRFGEAMPVDVDEVLEVFSEKVVILSRIVQSTYVQALYDEDGITTVEPEVVL